jgi:hypothetical protein
MTWIHGDWIDDDESLARAPSRWAFDPYLRQVLEQAGWQPLPPPVPLAAGDPNAYAQALLAEFGGLKLVEITDGSGLVAHEIDFAKEPKDLSNSDVKRWPHLAGSKVIASVARGYAVLFVDGDGELYLTDDVLYRLYSLGNDFVAIVNMLVRQQPWPIAMPD